MADNEIDLRKRPLPEAIRYFSRELTRRAAEVGDMDLGGFAIALDMVAQRADAELSEYEVFNPQQCGKGIHPDWLIDSEHTHACPWCANDELTAEQADLQQRFDDLQKETHRILDVRDRTFQRQRDEIARLTAELAKYVGHEPTLDDEARHQHEQQVREKVAADIQAAIDRSRKHDGELDGPNAGMAARRLGLLSALRIVQGDDQFGMPHATEGGADRA